MAENPIVSSLPNYVEGHRLPIIAKSVLNGKTVELFQLATGIKTDTALNLIDTDVKLGDGSKCGFNSTTTTTLSQRLLKPTFFKVNQSLCDASLLKKWAAYEVTVAAGRNTLPFEQYFTESVANGISEQIETLIWSGSNLLGAGTPEFKGIVPMLEELEEGPISLALTPGATAYNHIKEVYNKIPARLIGKDDTVIFVSESTYREFINDLVAANLYHFSPDYKSGEYTLPGSSVRVIAVPGLERAATAIGGEEDDRVVIAGRLSNFYYGVDAEDDKSTFDLWYSKDNQEFRIAAKFALAVQFARPDEIVFGSTTL